MKIGYQGIKGSNSERAAKKLKKEMHLDAFELIPLLSSSNVVKAIKNKDVEYGVLAVRNSRGGLVKESVEAIISTDLDLVLAKDFRIHHNLYVLDKTIKLDDIEVIASHPQAIKQCEKYIEKTFNKAKIINSPDTAYAAKALANGAYTKNTAVLCRKDAGEKNGLYKLAKHVEDRIDNRTEFHLYKDV